MHFSQLPPAGLEETEPQTRLEVLWTYISILRLSCCIARHAIPVGMTSSARCNQRVTVRPPTLTAEALPGLAFHTDIHRRRGQFLLQCQRRLMSKNHGDLLFCSTKKCGASMLYCTHCPIVPLSHCAIVPLFHCPMVALFRCGSPFE